MYCIRCGKENLDSAKFCNECGYDFRTLKKNAQPEREEYVQSERVREKKTGKAESFVREEPVMQKNEAEVPEKKKGGFLRKVVISSVVALAVFFVSSGGLTELMNELYPEEKNEPTMIVVPDPDSRYDITIVGTADDEFRTVMEMLIDERDTMETPVFVRYEWKALQKFKGASFEHYDLGRLAGAYLQVVESQQNLYNISYTIRINDETLHDQAQNNKTKLLIYMMLYCDLMPDRPDVRIHYEKMDHAYLNEQLVHEDLKAQLLGVDFLTDTERNIEYLTYTNNTDMTFALKVDGTYEYPESYDGNGGYMFEEWQFDTIRPGETVSIDFTKLDTTRKVNVKLKWNLENLYVDGEEVYSYYLQHK